MSSAFPRNWPVDQESSFTQSGTTSHRQAGTMPHTLFSSAVAANRQFGSGHNHHLKRQQQDLHHHHHHQQQLPQQQPLISQPGCPVFQSTSHVASHPRHQSSSGDCSSDRRSSQPLVVPSFIKRKSDVGPSSTKWHLRLVQQQQQQQQQQSYPVPGYSGSTISHVPYSDSPSRRSLSARISMSDVRSFSSQRYSGQPDEDLADGQERVKDKLLSLWNNVKYGWNVKLQSSFNCESPIWLLGRLYHFNNVSDSRSGSSSSYSPATKNRPQAKGKRDFSDPLQVQRRKEETMARFKQDYYSRIWFTYRRNFTRIEGSNLTSDCGWGCMLRSGQMLMAQAFISQYLGRDWRWTGSQSDKNDMIHRMIVKWFTDEPESPFSIHQLVKIGSSMGKKAGDWYGPATTAHLLTQALAEAFIENPILENVVSYVAQDCTVFVQDVIKLCTENVSVRRRCSIVKREARTRASFSGLDFDLARVAAEAEAMDYEQDEEPVLDEDTVLVNDEDTIDDCDVFVDLEADIVPRVRGSAAHLRASSTFNLYSDSSQTATSTATSGYASMSSSHVTEAPTFSFTHNSQSSSAKKHSLPPSSQPSAQVNHRSDRSSEHSNIQDEKTEKWRGVVIFIPVRLGGEKFNPVYTEVVKSLFAHPATLGIMGGRPKHSLYFIGVQEDKLIYLDPHLCQDALDVSQVTFPLSSFHCHCARKMSITKMDPSCTIAFHVRSRAQLNDLMTSVKDFLVPGQRHTDYPIFVFADSHSQATSQASTRVSESLLHVRHRFLDDEGHVERESMSEDFVLIS